MYFKKIFIPGVLIIEPTVFNDDRGFFLESWNQKNLFESTGIDECFVQDNHSRSVLKGVLRGLHYQLNFPQAKLVRAISGRILDVVVDLRKSSPTFGKHFSIELNDSNNLQLWVPVGLAHGSLTISANADVLYKTTEYYSPSDEVCIKWNDKSLNIDWRLNGNKPQLSIKDEKGIAFKDAQYFL